MKKGWLRQKSGLRGGLGRFVTSNETNFDDHAELPMTIPQPSKLFNEGTDWDGYALDSNCIDWMFETPVETEVNIVIGWLIPEIVWHVGIRTTPLERPYDTFSGCPTVEPTLRGKALLDIGTQRKCIGNESEKAVFGPISSGYRIVVCKRYEGDSDPESTLGIIGYIFGGYESPMNWKNFFTVNQLRRD